MWLFASFVVILNYNCFCVYVFHTIFVSCVDGSDILCFVDVSCVVRVVDWMFSGVVCLTALGFCFELFRFFFSSQFWLDSIPHCFRLLTKDLRIQK